MDICGVDAGGTKTAAALYDENGLVTAEAMAGFGNMLNGPEEAVRNICRAAGRCVEGRPGVPIVVGAAGISAAENRDRLLAALEDRLPGHPVTIITDAMLMLYAQLEGGDGIIVIAGTGSIAYGLKDGTTTRQGGWGALLGDKGSGYDIVRQSFAEITREYDAGNSYSPCSQKILEALETDVFGAVSFLHRAPKGDVAALLPLVVESAAEGDGKALLRLRRAGEVLAGMAQALYRKTGFDTRVPTVPAGGVLQHVPQVKRAFLEALEHDPGLSVLDRRNPATKGAYYLERSRYSR